MTGVLKVSDWQLSSVMQLNSHEALCMENSVCTSSGDSEEKRLLQKSSLIFGLLWLTL